MDGGLLQLIAKGAEDMPFINKPEITHFKKMYRKIGNFSIMDSEVLLDDLAFEKTKLSKIPKIGDLISKVYLELNIPDFKVMKIETQNFTEEIFRDENYLVKFNILNKILEIENLDKLQLDDTTLINLSPNSLAKNILQSYISKIEDEYTTFLPTDNYKIISYLLTSNLKEEDIILGDFILRYLEISNESTLISTDYLINNYNELYQNLVTNYYQNIPFENPEKYSLSEEINQELLNFLIENKKTDELELISRFNTNPIDFIKNSFVYDAEILKNLIKLIFPNDNFRDGSLKEQTILPFFIYLYYDVNNNNRIRYELTDTKLISSIFIKENLDKIRNNVDIDTPVIQLIQNTFEKIKVESENYFKSVNYQKMLGNDPQEILAILIAITETWKWNSYDFSNKDKHQLIPGLEVLNLTQIESGTLDDYVSSLSFFKDLQNSDNFEKIIQENITLDFERKKIITSSDEIKYHNLEKIIDLVKSQISVLTPFNLSNLTLNSSYLNRTAIDLSLILVYISYLFRNKLLNNSFLKKDSSNSWVNFLNETICSKFYAKWSSEFTSRIDETYVGSESYLESNGESNIRLDNKVPLVIFPNNTYNITSNSIKDLIKLQTHKFNYYLNESSITGSDSLRDYQMKTIKKFKDLSYSIISENNKNFLVINDNIVNIWYHNFTNEYYLITKNNNYQLTFYSIKNNKIYFTINDNIELDNIEYLKVIINQKISVNSGGKEPTITTITTTQTFTDLELTYYYFFKIFYDEFNNIIDILPIPKRFIVDNNLEISDSFTLDNEPEHTTNEIKYLNQLELPNLLYNYDFTGDYLSFTKLEETDIGKDYGLTNSSTEDKYRYNSYLHQISFILRDNSGNGNLNLYHLPYKINSQVYQNITVECETYLDDKLVEIKGRFGNKFNLREKIDDDTIHLYSEGVDFYDNNLDYNKVTITSTNEDVHLADLDNLLQSEYSQIESKYQKIVNAHDLITKNLFKKFIDCLENIKSLGSIYSSFIDNFMQYNDINLDNLKYFQESSFTNAFFWSNNLGISSNSLTYTNEWATSKEIAFNDWETIDFTKSNSILSTNSSYFYLPKKIYQDSLLEYFNKYQQSLVLQITNLEENLDFIEKHPRISKSILNQDELDFVIQKSFSKINQQNYLLETETSITQTNPLYFNNNKVTLEQNNTDNNIVTSDVLLNDIHNIKPYNLQKNKIDVNPNTFYDYAITMNNKVVFLPKDFYDNNNNYSLNFINSLLSGITYQEITFDYIIFSEDSNITNLVTLSKNNLLVLEDENGNYLPFGKLIPDFVNPLKYYRLGKTSKNTILKNNLIFENNLIENFQKKDNILYVNNFKDTSIIINPIYHSNNLKLEYYDDSFNIVSNSFSLASTLRINKFDFIYLVETEQWYMFDDSLNLDSSDLTSEKFYLFRFISNTSKNVDLFESSGYDFSNITFENMILLAEELLFLETKDNKIIDNTILSEGDLIYDKTSDVIHQVINFKNDLLETYPEITLSDENEYRVFKNIYLDSGLIELSTYNITLPHGSYTFEYLTSYTFYQLPQVYLPNPWEYREIKQGDLIYKDNTLELQTSSSSENWVYQSKDNWVTFTNDSGNWYSVNTQDLQIGDFIYNLAVLSTTHYSNDPDEYLHTGNIQAQVLGRVGKYYYLSANISDNTWLVKSYPLKIKPTIEQLENKMYQVKEDKVIIEKINFPSIKITSQKYLVDISSNILNVNSGYDNNQKTSLTFDKSLVYPEQKILIDNKYWTTIKNYDTLELSETIPDLENVEMTIPETVSYKLLTENNETFNKLEYLNSLQENDKIFCSLIIFDNGFHNKIVYCDNLLLTENKRNIITFEFEDKSFEEKFVEIADTETSYFTNFYVNINNKFILVPLYDLNENKIYCFKNLNSSFNLISQRELNNTHFWTTFYDEATITINQKYVFNTQKPSNLNMINNLKVNLLNSEQQTQSLVDNVYYLSEIYYNDITFKIIKEYSYENKYLEEYQEITLDYNNIFNKDDKYLLELNTNPVNNLDDRKIYQIINDTLQEGKIIENDEGIFIECDNQIYLNLPFYQKKKHLIYNLKENILSTRIITNYNYEYFHYRIGFELLTQYEDADQINDLPYSSRLIRVGDYLDYTDFNVPDNNFIKMIINNNIKHYFDNKTLPITEYSDGTLTFSDSSYNKNTLILKIPDNDYDFTNKYKSTYDEYIYYQTDMLVEQIKTPISYDNLIKNELDLQKNLMLEYSKENYLLVKLLEEINWEKIISLSNNEGVNYSDDIFFNDYTYQDDYNKYKDIELTLELQTKHDNILALVKDIYSRIPSWILLEEFKNNPDDYLNKFLEERYQLIYQNNTFYNLDGTLYLTSKIPTYFKISEISSTLYLEYLVKKENVSNDENYFIFEELMLQEPSQDLGIKLVHLVDFYSFWDKLKLGIPENYRESEVYLDRNVTNLRLSQIQRKKILDLYDANITEGMVIVNNDENKLEYKNNNIFEYLVNLTSMPDDLEFYEIDFREDNLVLTDFETDFIVSRKGKARMKLDRFLLDNGIDLYGKINYKITQWNYLGNKYQLTLPSNSIPDMNYSVGINLDEITDVSNIDSNNIVISYNDLSNIDFINILVRVSIRFKKGKYYFINDNVKDWIDENTYLKHGEDLTKLQVNGNEILSPKPKSTNITLSKVVKITTKTNLNEYRYQVDLDKSFNNSPSYGYHVKAEDLVVDNVICKDFGFVNSLLYLTFDEDIQIGKELEQKFKLNYQNKYQIEQSEIDKTILEYGDENNINLLNKFYLNLTDKNNMEIGNYIYRTTITGTFSGETTPVYYIKNKRIQLLGNLLDGYLATIDYINPEEDLVVFELNNDSSLGLSDLQFIYRNYYGLSDLSVKFSDVVSNINLVDFTKLNLNLEEELVEEELKNSLIDKCSRLLEDLKETKNYEKYQNYIVEEEPIFKENFGYDILNHFLVKLYNSEIEKFDNKMFREYCYYFLDSEKIKGLNKMLNNSKKIIIPLPFWFCRNWNGSLPLVLSNESQFYIEYGFNKLGSILENTGTIINKPKINGKFVFKSIWLGDEEKNIIGNKKQDYLVETFHKSQIESLTNIRSSIDLKFVGAVKDIFFSFYLNDKVENHITEEIVTDNLYLEYTSSSENNDIVDSTEFLDLYEDILDRFTPYFKDKYFVGFLIIKYIEFSPTISKIEIIRRLIYYWKDFYLKKRLVEYYPLKQAEYLINNYQYIRNKSDLFWSAKNQMLYSKSGDKGYYGLSYALHPLEQQPSGFTNHNHIDSNLIIELNQDYLDKAKEIGDTINLEISYRKYRLIRFMGNQAGILW